ncbi:metallophosphoesterase [Bacillus gobiensis]|uniref:metallophosphoesterase n=1 Tax=Bacillus gobiensis TaxID=1441095 RepID=UPI003D23A8F4
MSKKRRFFIILIVLVTLLIVFFNYENNSIMTSEINIHSNKVPHNFDGFRIVHLSDLHSKAFGKNQSGVIQKVKELNPDLIVFTGDLVDQKNYDEKPSLDLMQESVKISPVYFVTGNHERFSGKFSSLEEKLRGLGVNVMRNTHESIQIGQEEIHILGIDDPSMGNESITEYSAAEEAIKNSLQGIKKEGSFKILLSHRPELFSLYTQFDMDLILSGHAHGGQFRIPFIGGVIAPNQGFFPQYTSGKYNMNHSSMIVSRGLGNSVIPQRVLNRPEIISITLSPLN